MQTDMKINTSGTSITHLKIEESDVCNWKEWSHEVGLGQLKWNLTIYDESWYGVKRREKIWQHTYFLIYIGCNDMCMYQTIMNWGMLRMQVRKIAMLLTCCWSKKKMWWDCFSQNVQSHSLAVGDMYVGKDVMRLLFTNVQCHSHPVGDRMRLGPFTKCAMSLTICWW